MNKKILIGSIIAVLLLLLMPSIPAIQQKTIEDKAYSDFIELLKDVDLEDLQEKIDTIDFKDLNEIKAFLNNNYDFDSKLDISGLLQLIVFFIFGLITWIPAIIFCVLMAIPYILGWTLVGLSYYEDFRDIISTPIIDLIMRSLYNGFLHGLQLWLLLFSLAILWPFAIVIFISIIPEGPL